MALKIEPIRIKRVEFGIVGLSPLIQHAWSDKGLDMLRKTPAERRKVVKTARDPEAEAAAAAYRTETGDYGLPILAFKSALISASHKDIGLEKTLVRKSLFFPCQDANKCVPLDCDEPVCREDIVRVGVGQTDLRYRPEFQRWGATLVCEIDASALSEQDLVNLINRAGFGVGLCEWRPEKGGEFGRFRLDVARPMKILEEYNA